ncbi:hypothetical protein D3C87_1132510 [compost metagenome]
MADDEGAWRPGFVLHPAATQHQLAPFVAGRFILLTITRDDTAPHIAFEHHGVTGEYLDRASLAAFGVPGFFEVAAYQRAAPGRVHAPTRMRLREPAGQTRVFHVGHGAAHRVDAAIGAREFCGGVHAVRIAHRTAGDVEQRAGTRDDGPAGTQHDAAGIGRQLPEVGLAHADPAGHIRQWGAYPLAWHVDHLAVAVRPLDPLHARHRSVAEHAVFPAVDNHFLAAQPGVQQQR